MNVKELISGLETGNKKSFWWITGIILAVAAALRLSGLGFSYSNDELSALVRVRFDSFSQLVDNGFYVDGHPGGIQVFLYYWVKIFGMGEWAVRLPFAIGGVLAVYFSIRLFSKWFTPSTGLLTGAFLAFLEFPLLYSQIARPYGSGLLFSMMMAWYWTRLLFDEKPSKGIAIAYSLSAAACMYNHYFSFLLALIIGITGLFFLKRDRIIYYLTAGAGAALLFTPHIYITLNHLSIGGVGLWLTKPENDWLWGHIFYIFNDSLVQLILAGSVVIISLISGYKILRFNKFHIFSFLFFILPFIVGFFYSRLVNPVLQHSVLIFSFPFFLALIFSFSGRLAGKYNGMIILAVLILGTTQTIIGNRYFSKQHFGEFRGIAQIIDKWNRQYVENNITRAININNPWYLDFYLDKTAGGRTTFEQYDNRGGLQLDTLAGILNSCRTDYFIYAWTKPAPFEISDMIRSRYPCVVEHVSFGGLSEATLYSRNKRCSNPLPDTLFKAGLDSEQAISPGIFRMDSLEFSPGFEGTPESVLKGRKGILIASLEMLTDIKENNAILVISFHDDKGETIHWLGARADLYSQSGKWCSLRQTITIPDQELLNNRMKVYLWNREKKNMLIRKLSITLEQPFIEGN